MKTIPVSLIVAGVLIPVAAFAEPRPQGDNAPPPRDGEGQRGPKRSYMEFWKSADKDQDGFISKAEYDALPRIQNLPEEKRASLFQRLDKDSDGKLAREELGRMGKPHDGQGPPMQRLWELDADKSGGVSFEEFKAGHLFMKLPPEKQDQIFKRLDTDHDGTITPKDKPEPFRRGGGGGHMDPCQNIRQFDKNGDGALSFEEFRVGPMVKDLTEDEQEDRFEAMDKNHDQKLTPEDFPPPPPRGEPKPPEGGGPPPADR